MALKKLPFRNVSVLLKQHLSTEEDVKTDALIRELARGLGITFVMVTHELASIYSVADRVILLDPHIRGIAAEGPPAWLRDHAPQPWVRQFLNREAA